MGSHLVETLLNLKQDVVIGDLSMPSLKNHLPYWFRLDLTKREHVRDLLKKHDFDTIYHLAAIPITLGENWRCDFNTFNTNAIGTYNLVSQCNDDTTIIMASTANIYGNVRKAKENNPKKISSMYGYSKCIAEQIVSNLGLRHIIFRFGTVIGTRGRCFPNRLVWCVVNKKHVEIFNDGLSIRDFVNVQDVVDGLLVAKGLPNGLWNLGGNVEVDGKELATLVTEEAQQRGFTTNFTFIPSHPKGYVSQSSLDSTKLLSTGLWKPKVSLKESIKSMFDYYEKGGIEPPNWESL